MSQLPVLVVHNRYRFRGGEEAVFEEETALLEAHGHRVDRLLFDNHDLPEAPSIGQKVRLGLETVWSSRARGRLREAIQEFRPRIVHFHNTLPQISPAAYEVCKEAGAGVVQTLHNYRLLCPGAMFYRDGHPCEDCLGSLVPLSAVAHACYRGSRTETGALVAMLVAHRLKGTFRRDVDAYISPSDFLKRKLIQGGYPESRIMVKPNFVAPDPGQKQALGDYVLYSGRLTATKGIETLIAAYESDPTLPPLRFDGHGDMESRVAALAAKDHRVTFQRSMDRAGVFETMGNARCLVLPSIWYENFPVTIPEAFSRGLPIIASDIGALADIIDHDRTGLRFRPGDALDLAAKIKQAWQPDVAERLGAAARREYVAKYTGEINYEQLIGAYSLALGEQPEAGTAASVLA